MIESPSAKPMSQELKTGWCELQGYANALADFARRCRTGEPHEDPNNKVDPRTLIDKTIRELGEVRDYIVSLEATESERIS